MLLEKRRSNTVTILKYCLITLTVTSGVHAEPKRYDLIHYLLSDQRYDHSLPPDFYTENVTNVSVELSITDLNSESDINMEFEFTLYLRLNWTDKRLDFEKNRTSYDSLKLGDDIVDKIWIPDLYFHHERKSELHGLFTKNQLVYIYRNGSVLYSGRFNVKSHCAMDLKFYPYDIQNCPVVIQSYAFSKEDLLLHWNGDNAVKIDHAASLKYSQTSQRHTYVSPYADPVGNFSTLISTITFKRPTESFEIMYIAPPIILVLVSFSSFFLGDSVGARITVPTGSLTQLIMQWAGIYSKLPPVSDLTYIDRWMLYNVIFVAINIIVNASICHCFARQTGTTAFDTLNPTELSIQNRGETNEDTSPVVLDEQNGKNENEGEEELEMRTVYGSTGTTAFDTLNPTGLSIQNRRDSSDDTSPVALDEQNVSFINRCWQTTKRNINTTVFGVLALAYLLFTVSITYIWKHS